MLASWLVRKRATQPADCLATHNVTWLSSYGDVDAVGFLAKLHPSVHDSRSDTVQDGMYTQLLKKVNGAYNHQRRCYYLSQLLLATAMLA